jgi:23S rRNA (adenine2503-C2)-methyltransferase
MSEAVPIDLLGLPVSALERALESIGVPGHQAGRLFRGLHRDGLAVDQVPDLGKEAIRRIGAAGAIASAHLVCAAPSDDGAEKLLIGLGDGAQIEAVLIPMRADRTTVCLSTQVGCGIGCAFCATARLGLVRSLTAGEIVAQLRVARGRAQAAGRAVSHVVLMGMGEPLANYAATRDAVRVLLDPRADGLKARHVTVSTVGLVPRMQELAADFGGRIQLALSLHAGTDATRERIIPVAARFPLAELRAALDAWPLPGTRALMLEYVVLPGVNDGASDLDGLIQFASGLRCLVNLIPFNPFAGAAFRTPSDAEVQRVADFLAERRIPASIRWPRGRGVAGACGQLAGAESR